MRKILSLIAFFAVTFALPLSAAGPNVVCEQGASGRYSGSGWTVKSPSPATISITSNIVMVVGFPATAGTLVQAANSGTRSVFVQNQGISTIFCGFTVDTTAAKFFVALKGGAAANDGTGAAVSLSQYAGPVYCMPSNTSSTFVSVGAY
jgi:hypothetical protein